ncbi:MAG: transposase [Bacteroidia bacterium]|nr:transposase [Bacteroidia bacterium]
MAEKRKFTTEQKPEILQFAEHHGMAETLRRYELTQSLFYRWKGQFNSGGV